MHRLSTQLATGTSNLVCWNRMKYVMWIPRFQFPLLSNESSFLWSCIISINICPNQMNMIPSIVKAPVLLRALLARAWQVWSHYTFDVDLLLYSMYRDRLILNFLFNFLPSSTVLISHYCYAILGWGAQFALGMLFLVLQSCSDSLY